MMKVWVLMERGAIYPPDEPIAVFTEHEHVQKFIEDTGYAGKDIVELAEVYANPENILEAKQHRFWVTLCEQGSVVYRTTYVPPDPALPENRWKEGIIVDGLPNPDCIIVGIKAKNAAEAHKGAREKFREWLKEREDEAIRARGEETEEDRKEREARWDF